MKELIKVCTEDVHFNFNGTTYVQKDGLGMGSQLAGISIVELE